MATLSPLRDLYRRPGFLLKRCHQISAAIFLEECRGLRMTPSQYGCLRALHEFPGIDQLALGRLVGLDRSTAGLVVKTLDQRGLIERVINHSDKRRMRLRVSRAGERVLDAIAPAAARVQQRVLSVLPRASRSALLELLERLLAGHDALIDTDDVLAIPPASEPDKRARHPSVAALSSRRLRSRRRTSPA